MTKTATSFDEAFKMLDDAYNDLASPSISSLVQEAVGTVKRDVRVEAGEALAELDRGRAEIKAFSSELATLGAGHVREITSAIDKEIRANPMLFMGAAAAGALALGFIAALATSSSKENRIRESARRRQPVDIDALAEEDVQMSGATDAVDATAFDSIDQADIDSTGLAADMPHDITSVSAARRANERARTAAVRAARASTAPANSPARKAAPQTKSKSQATKTAAHAKSKSHDSKRAGGVLP